MIDEHVRRSKTGFNTRVSAHKHATRVNDDALPGGRVPTIVKIGLAAAVILLIVFTLAQLRQNGTFDSQKPESNSQ